MEDAHTKIEKVITTGKQKDNDEELRRSANFRVGKRDPNVPNYVI